MESRGRLTPEHDEPLSESRPALVVLVASALGLFLELALIRWLGSEVRVFAYCKNLVLVACFLGFGTGCFLHRRRSATVEAMLLLLLLVLTAGLTSPWLLRFGPRRVTVILSELPGFMIFRAWDGSAVSWGMTARLAFATGWTTLLFFAVALVMVPFGQLTSRGIAALRRPLWAYSVNVAGSLLGILAFTGVTVLWLPPVCWFVPVALACALLAPKAQRPLMLGLTLALTLVLLPPDEPQQEQIWSTYQKLDVLRGRNIIVNNTGYQDIEEQPDLTPGRPAVVTRVTMPYALRRPPGRVLIVGAGAGNDAAAALSAGAASVTAVEIDRAIYWIGRRNHPQRPYANARVRVVIDDARHFLHTTGERFDVIVFSHLDSHTLLSSFTNVRLDNYVYTVESFREARGRLAPGGILFVSFFAERTFIGERLEENLEAAFGHPPVTLEGMVFPGDRRHVYFLTGEPPIMSQLEATSRDWPDYRRVSYRSADPVPPSSDAWPFLFLERRVVPPVMLLISLAILIVSVALAVRARPRGEPFDGRLFWLGAAFMLLEVHNVSRLALVFGTTWQVNAWVIGAILVVILLANATCMLLRSKGREPGWPAAVGLFVSLIAAASVPLGWLGALGATVLLSLPIFFAGLIFAEAFAQSASPGFALGWNVLGAVLGGLSESASYALGIPSLIWLAAAFYALALLSRRQDAVPAPTET